MLFMFDQDVNPYDNVKREVTDNGNDTESRDLGEPTLTPTVTCSVKGPVIRKLRVHCPPTPAHRSYLAGATTEIFVDAADTV